MHQAQWNLKAWWGFSPGPLLWANTLKHTYLLPQNGRFVLHRLRERVAEIPYIHLNWTGVTLKDAVRTNLSFSIRTTLWVLSASSGQSLSLSLSLFLTHTHMHTHPCSSIFVRTLLGTLHCPASYPEHPNNPPGPNPNWSPILTPPSKQSSKQSSNSVLQLWGPAKMSSLPRNVLTWLVEYKIILHLPWQQIIIYLTQHP